MKSLKFGRFPYHCATGRVESSLQFSNGKNVSMFSIENFVDEENYEKEREMKGESSENKQDGEHR